MTLDWATASFERYRRTHDANGVPGDSERVIAGLDFLITKVPTHSQEWISVNLKLGDVYSERMSRQSRRVDAEGAERHFRNVLQHDSMNSNATVGLALSLRLQYEWTGNRQLLEEALDIVESTIARISVNNDGLPRLLDACGLILLDRAELFGSAADLDIAVEIFRAGLEASTNNDTWKLSLDLSTALRRRFEANEQRSDLLEARSLIRELLFEPNRLQRERVECQLLYANILHVLYKHETNRECDEPFIARIFAECGSLLRAIYSYSDSSLRMAASERAALAYHDGHLDKGTVDELFKAIKMANRCVRDAKIWTKDWNCRRIEAKYQFVLGTVQALRHQSYGGLPLLENSIHAYRRCVAASDTLSADFAIQAGHLSAMLLQKYDILRRPADLEEAKTWMVRASRSPRPMCLAQRTELARQCANLIFQISRGAGNELEGINRACRHLDRAIGFGTTNLSQQTVCQQDFANLIQAKGDITNNKDDYIAGIGRLIKVFELCGPRKLAVTSELTARIFFSHYKLTGNPGIGQLAIKRYNDLVHTRNASSQTRIEAAERCAALESVHSPNSGMIISRECVLVAFDLMAEAVSARLERKEQLRLIRTFSRLPKFAVLCALRGGLSAHETILLFERGRSLLWNHLLNPKAQISELYKRHERLASRLTTLEVQMSEKGRPSKYFKDSDPYHLATEYHRLISEIRQQEGFGDFLLLPSSPSQLQDCAREGPIVFIVPQIVKNETVPAQALIIEHGKITRLTLPQLTEEKSSSMAENLRRALTLSNSKKDYEREQASELLNDVFIQLWETAAEPIMENLGFSGPQAPEDELPRVWWITSGWINILPIHAAGNHKAALRTGKPCTVLDRVISSYAPTLKALIHARSRMDDCVSRPKSSAQVAMVVAMDNTPDMGDLKYAPEEIKGVEEFLSKRFKVQRPPLMKLDIDKMLPICTVAHFACHGVVDAQDPLQSKLLLKDWGRDPLTINTLMQMQIENCQLAYLSACETAANKDMLLRDEGLHISGAFQMAGVPNTIASWWEISDPVSVDVAKEFYNGVLIEKGDFDFRRSAASLHKAIQNMRNKAMSPFHWGAYVHFGV